MSERIYKECSFINKKEHNPEDCRLCPFPSFWDEAYQRLISELRPIPQGA